MDILKGIPAEYADIIDFANYVFSSKNDDFPTLLPKLYANEPEVAKSHYLIKEQSKIRAMVGSFDLDMNVMGDSFKVKGIGTVSVHRYSRSKGYMQELMNKAVSDMREENVDFAVLGGQRQRYEYFGFTPCGVAAEAEISIPNVRHLYGGVPHDFTFKEVTEHVAEHATENDEEVIVQMADMNNSKPAFSFRPKERFFKVSSTWLCKIIAVYKAGAFQGYLLANKNNERIAEIVLREPEMINDVLINFAAEIKKTIKLTLYPYQVTEIRLVNNICEDGCCFQTSANFNVFNYKKTIKAFLTLKNSYSPLEDGTFTIDIKERGRYKIFVSCQNITVDEADGSYDISLTHLEAMQFLFSPSAAFTAQVGSKSWFPLPLFIHGVDNV